MEKLIQKSLLYFVLLVSVTANGQCIYHRAQIGSDTAVTFTLSGGTFASYGCAPIDPTYWVSGFGATMTMTFTTPQTNPSFRVWGMNNDDSASVNVNGSPYAMNLASASYDPKIVCGISPGPNGVTFANGKFYGFNTNGQGNYSYQNITINASGITSITVKAISGAGWGFAGASTSCSSSVLPPVASFQSSDSTICANVCISFTDLSTNATSWKWSFTGGTPSASTDKNPPSVCYLASGLFDVQLIAYNSGGSDTLTYSNFIHVLPAPPTPVITRSNDTLYCSTDPSYTSYQWYKDTVLIHGATGTYLVITQDANYNVAVSNEFGCSIAVGINIDAVIPTANYAEKLSLFPNPAHNELNLKWGFKSGSSRITIFDVLGKKVQEDELMSEDQASLNIKNLTPGVYFIRISNDNMGLIGKVVKE